MKERITIQIDRDVADTVRGMYPGMSYTKALRLLLESKDNLKMSKDNTTLPASTIPPVDNLATIEDIKELKDKFSAVLENLITKNNLKR